jgi:hypothetical protein
VAGRIRSLENSNDLIRNRTHELPACSIVPQPTMLPCGSRVTKSNFLLNFSKKSWLFKISDIAKKLDGRNYFSGAPIYNSLID